MIAASLFMLALTACTPPETERDLQQQKVTSAQKSLQKEEAYLQTLRDSLPIKIQQNLKLGLPARQAEAVEQALIKTQETLVKAAQQNLLAQQAFLDSLNKYQP